MFLIERTVTEKGKTSYQAMLAALRHHARKDRRVLKHLGLPISKNR
ncbi:hypothetical protein [Micromonospora sp. NPDC050200]